MHEYITTIGLNAFSYCKSLKTITIPESVFSIEHSCFEFCENLTSITIPKNVTSISYNMFYACKFCYFFRKSDFNW